MEQFENYLIDEYKDKAKGYVAVDFKFTHSVNVKIDKKSNVPLKNNIIKVNVTFYDKLMKKLFSQIITFENNIIPKNKEKTFINISPKELNNKFNVAKKYICADILNSLTNKRNELNEKINDVQNYLGCEGIIPNEFKGELITVVEGENVGEKDKNKFDM